MHELCSDVYNGAVSELQRHVCIKHREFQKKQKFYRICVEKRNAHVK